MVKKFLGLFQKKSLRTEPFDLLGLLDFAGMGWHEVRAALAWNYYAKVSPINRAVNLIANEAASLEFVIKNVKTDEYIRRGDAAPVARLLDKLSSPSNMVSQSEFIKSVVASFLVCGEFYICVTGITEPQEIYFVNPSKVIVLFDGGLTPSGFTWTEESGTIEFKRQMDGQYISTDGTKRFYQSIDFNPFYTTSNQRGFSRLSSIYYEIEQWIQGMLHNISNLKRGARPSGALMCEDDITPEQVNSIKEQIIKFYSGSVNGGNVMVLSKGRDFKQLSLTNKDMDYSGMVKQIRDTIYQELEIPASFYDNSASSFNNKMNDRINLYIFALLPVMRRVCEEFTEFLIPMYIKGDKDRSTYRVEIIEKEIPALEPMFDEANLKKSQSGVFTINELREKYGLDDLGEDGDTVYQPVNLVPIGSDVDENEESDAGKKPKKKDDLTDDEMKNRIKALDAQLAKLNYSPKQRKAMIDVATV